MAADAETKVAKASEASPRPAPGPRRFPLPQLRLHDRRVYVGFGATPLGEGLSIADLALTVPDVSFPFDIAGGAATRYQRRRCRFGYLDLEVDHALFERAMGRVQAACAEHVAALRLHLSALSFEGEGLLHTPSGPAPFTFRVGFAPEGQGVIACVYDVRLYGPAPLPAPFAAALLARAALRANALPGARAFGAVGLSFDPVEGLVRKAVPLRGFRVPDCSDARLERVEPGPRAFHLRFAAGARPEVALDAELLSCVEGCRAFSEGEERLAQGDLAGAEAFFLRRGEAPDAHPFARERLLGLLAAREEARDLALDVAAALRQARPGAAAGWWAEACLRLARHEGKLAGELFLKLGSLARSRGEEASAFQAFCAAGRALLEPAPGPASRAFQDALALRPDDLDALQALALAGDRAGDPEGSLRAWRRIAALARDPAQAARAHVRLGELLTSLTRDRSGARLHYDAALRRVPSEPDALYGLARLCRADGEHLRALKLLDELRAEASRRSDPALEARACLEAGAAWDEGLSHPANALLRYQEAERLSPTEYEPSLRLAALLERLGRPAEAAEAWQRAAVQAEAQIGRVAGSEVARRAAHQAHHALARLASERLGDPASARRHLESAAKLDPDDSVALRALLPLWRAEARQVDVARACERCAAVTADARERAALLSEAGELYAGPLNDLARAGAVLDQALLFEPTCERALEATARLAESAGDGPRLCRALLRLVEAAAASTKPALLRRLARAARDVASDLDLAADALQRALVLEPDVLADLGELCALHRRRQEAAALDPALASWARALERDGQFPAAAAALHERALLLDAKLARGAEALALLEKAAALAPDDRGVLEDLAELSLRSARPLAAREAYRALIGSLSRDARPDQVALLQAGLGRACQALGDRDGALAALAAAFAARPSDDDLGARLDTLLADAGREADRAAARLARARAKRQAGLPGAAAAEFLAAARLFEELLDDGGAQAAFASALETDPDGPTAAPSLEALARAALDAKDPVRASELLARRAAFDAQGRAAARRLYHAAVLVKESSPVRFRALLAVALERDGDYPPARATLAWLRLNERDPAQALSHARLALADRGDPDALEPKDRISLQRLAARAAGELGDRETARGFLKSFVDARPEDVGALTELIALLRGTEDRAELIAALKRLATRVSGADAAAALRELAGLLRADPGQRAEAIDAWRRALQLEPDDRASLEKLAEALDAPAEAEERLAILRRLVELTADAEEKARLFVTCGEILFERSRFDEAAQAFQSAVALTKDRSLALERLAAAAERAGDASLAVQAAAQRAFLAADNHEPGAPERLLSAGSGLATLRRASEARRALELAVELAPADSSVGMDALDLMVTMAESTGERAVAAEVLRRLAARQQGSERCATLLRRVAHLEALGDLDEAHAALEEALAASPGDRRALLALRQMSLEAKNDQSLVRALEALLALPLTDRREAGAHASELADALLRLGEAPRAEAALRQALSFDRLCAGAEERLLSLLLARNALEEALPLGERLARACPDPEASRRLAELSRLADEGLHDSALALRFARLARERAPQEKAIRARLFELLYQEGAVSEALPLARELASEADFDADPEAARALSLRLAELFVEADQRPAAAEVLRGLLARDATDAAAANLLYELLLPSDPAAAVAALAQHARALSPGSRQRSLFLKLADDARKRLGAPRAAAEFLEQAQAIAGDGLDLATARVEALREAGDARALAVALRSLADLRLASDEPARALEALAEAAALLRESDPGAAAAVLGKCAELLLAARQAPEAARSLIDQAHLLRDALSDAEGAERALRRAFQLAPQDPAPAREAADLCRQRGDASGEADLLEAIVARQGPEARAGTLLRLAQLRIDLGDSSVAASHLEEALRLDRRLDAARDLYEQILGVEGRVAELARSFEARAELCADPRRQAALLRQAADLYAERVGDLESAARALKAACQSQPGDLNLAEACAEALCALGRPDEARALDAAIVALEPQRTKPFERQAAHLKEAGDFGALALLLEARAAQGPASSAAAQLIEAAALRERLGDREGSLRDERQAFELDPASERAFAAVMRRASGDVEAIAALLVRRAQAVPGEAMALHRSRGQLWAGAGRAEEAAKAIDEALAAEPQDVEALALRGEVSESLGGDAVAEPFDRRLLERSAQGVAIPQAPLARAHYRLGFAALSRGEAAAAEEHLGIAYALDPVHPRSGKALEALAAAYARAGDRALLFRVRMAQASRATDPEARAASCLAAAEAAPDVASEVAALSELAEIGRPDAVLLERLAAALARAGRAEASAAEYQRAAAAHADPATRARLLLEAAARVSALGDAVRSLALSREAWKASRSAATARAVLEDLRQSGDPELREALAVLAAEAGPEADAARLERARIVDRAEEKAAAADAFLEIVRRGAQVPGFEESAKRAAQLLHELGRFAEAAQAQAAAARALEDGPARAAGLAEAAKVLDELAGDAAGAEALLAEAAQASDGPEPLAALARMFERRGDSAGQARALEQEAQRLSTPAARAERLVRAGKLFAPIDTARSLAALQAAVEASPESAEPRLALADALEAQGPAPRALAEILKLAGTSPQAVKRTLLQRSVSIAQSCDRAPEAARIQRVLFDLDPADDEAWAAVRETAALADPQARVEALARREQALEARGPEAVAERVALACERALVFAGPLGAPDQAEQAWRHALTLEPRHRGALAGLRELAAARKDTAGLLDALEAEADAATDAAERFTLLVKLGDTARESDPARAAASYEIAIAAAPGASIDPGAVERSLAELLDQAQPARAAEIWERLALRQPEDVDLKARASQARLAAGDRTAARRHLREAVEAAPAREDLLDRYQELCADAPAERAFALLLRARRATAAEDQVDGFVRAAEAFSEAGDIEAEKDALRRSLEIDPRGRVAFERLAGLSSAEELLALLVERAEHAPEERTALLARIGLLRLKQGDLERAAQAFEDALRGDPEAADAIVGLAEARVRASRFEVAELDALGEACEPVALEVARLCEEQGAFAQSLAHYELAARRAAQPAEAIDGMARAGEASGDLGAALEACERVLRARPQLGAELAALHLKISEWCWALGRPLDALKHLEVAVVQGAGGPEALQKLADQYLAQGTWAEAAATLTWLAEQSEDPKVRGEAWRKAVEVYAEQSGDPAQAAVVGERALVDEPDAIDLMTRVCQLQIRHGEPEQVIRAVERLKAAAGAEAIAPFRLAYSKALLTAGRGREALELLQAALQDSFDAEVAAQLRDVAQAEGESGTAVSTELALIDQLGAERTAEAARRLRELAGRLSDGEPARAAELFARAFSLAPEDGDLDREAALRELAGDRAGALAPLLSLARRQPLDAQVLGRLASVLSEQGDAARLAPLTSLQAFLDAARRFPAPALGPVRVSDNLRAKLCEPAAMGPVAKLLRALAPALGTSFAGDLARYGVGDDDRVGPMHAPALAARIREAREAVGLSALDTYLAPGGGAEVSLEPGAPDRLVVGLAALTELEPGALSFLLVRACELSLSGWALATQAGPEGLEGLVRCALAASGAPQIPVPEPFDAMVEAVAEAVRFYTPPDLKRLVPAAAQRLSAFDAPALLSALERSAARVALVACGEPGAALRGLAAGAGEGALELSGLGERGPVARDLVLTCLRDDFAELLRAAREGA